MMTIHALRVSMLAAVLLAVISLTSSAQQALDGYTLFSPNNSRTTYLVDMQGNTVHTWQHARSGGYSSYLLPDGTLLRPASDPGATLRGAASSGLIEKVDWDGTVLWSYTYSSPTYIAHHDLEPMPNGNVLLIAWEVKSPAEVTAAGRTNATTLWPDHLVEVRPVGGTGGEIVWEWRAWDHLVQDRYPARANYGVVAEHPELLNVNMNAGAMPPGGGDWLHINGVSYNPDEDLVVISSHFMNEIYVIDHSTTTAEAAGHTGGRHGKGGDILYRWGNPANYGAPGSAVFDVVHCSFWIPNGSPGEGNILAFNNASRARASVIVEIEPPMDPDGRFVITPGQAYGPAVPAWTYSAGSAFFSNHLGGNQRLPNGNTLLTEATSGELREVTADGAVVWEYSFGREIARALRYPTDYSGLAELTASGAGEAVPESPVLRAWAAPNPAVRTTVLYYEAPRAGAVCAAVHDALGRVVRRFTGEATAGTGRFSWDGRDEAGNSVAAGVYLYRVSVGDARAAGKLLLR